MAGRYWMRAALCATSLWLGQGVHAQQFGADEKFTLRGHVVNAVTGEPVNGALVVLMAGARQGQFSTPDGTFEFAGLLRGRYMVEAKKPGYFSERDLGLLRGGIDENYEVPAEEDAVLKLTPEGVIYGRVEDEKGRPLEGLQVQADTWVVRDGKRSLWPSRMSVQTDDEGNFRIAELRPGDYFLKFSESGGNRTLIRDAGTGARRRRAAQANEANQGYGTQYYPGVAVVEAASAIHVRAGLAVPVQQKLERVRLYEVSGVVRGAPAGGGFSVMLTSGRGEAYGRTEVFANTGEFRILGVPPGRYLLVVRAADPANQGPVRRLGELEAQTLIEVNDDIAGLGLILGHGVTIGVQLRDERTRTNEGSVPVQVTLQSSDSTQVSQQVVAPPEGPRGARGFENVAGGTYSVEAFTFGQGYIASLRCAGTDLLKEELKVEAGTSVAPIEVRLRNDGAELSVSAVENGKPVGGRVIVYSEEYPRRSVSLVSWPNATTSTGMLPPGPYKLIATAGLGEVEYKNPTVMAKYLAHATSVTLAADTRVNMQVEVQELEPEQ